MERRTFAEVNLDAISSNYYEIRKMTTAKIMAVVKADAYGHGAIEVAQVLEKCGADYLGVATVHEGVQLRKAGIKTPMLILGHTHKNNYNILAQYDIMPTISSVEEAMCLNDKGQKVKIHIKVDTGMNRLGFDCNENSVEKIINISKLPNVEIEGIFSHLSCSDCDEHYTKIQFEHFTSFVNKIENGGVHIKFKHICNSGGLINYPDMHLDIVRVGILLYGLYPAVNLKGRLNIKPAMVLKTTVSQVRTVKSGEKVSYGGTYITDSDKKIATVGIGYADGYYRALSTCGKMQVGSQLVPILGKICMDQCMIDVTTVNNINVEDEVIVFGDLISVDDIADMLGTINYEIVCVVGKRVPRVYLSQGKVVDILNYLS